MLLCFSVEYNKLIHTHTHTEREREREGGRKPAENVIFRFRGSKHVILSETQFQNFDPKIMLSLPFMNKRK